MSLPLSERKAVLRLNGAGPINVFFITPPCYKRRRAAAILLSLRQTMRKHGQAAMWEENSGQGFKVMGILNITPDSFYAGSRQPDVDAALSRALKMAEEGADIIDVGGESTRPGSPRISEEEERQRVIPVIKAIAKSVSTPVSCDTYKANIAEEAIEAGASIINDISAFALDPRLFEVVKNAKCGYVLMHMQGTPADMQDKPYYSDVIAEIRCFFEKKLQWMDQNGMAMGNVAVDPGIGFGKRLQDNLSIIKNLSAFTTFGRPVLVGVSRKACIGQVLNGLPAEERLEGSLAAAVIALLKGADIIRTHDVKETKRALSAAKAINDASAHREAGENK